MQFAIRDLNLVAPGLTQASSVNLPELRLPIGEKRAAQLFTRTSMASITGDFLFEVGAGKLSPLDHTKLLVQHALNNDMPVSDIAAEYFQLVSLLGYSSEIFRSLVAAVLGSSERPVSQRSVPTVTPTFIHKHLQGKLPKTHEILIHMVSDFVCHMFAPLGWIVRDAPYVYRMRRSHLFPTYKSLIDMVTARDVMRVTQVLADADLSVLKKAIDSNKALVPTMVAQQLSSSMITAFELSRGSYDSVAIVTSTLTTLGRLWDPETPDALVPRERVRNSQYISDLRANLAMFISYQDMVGRNNVVPDVLYSDEEMVSVVLPLFTSALNEISPYRARPLSDVVGHFGKRSSYDHLHNPGHVVLFESWDFASDVTAFTAIKQTRNGHQRFLLEEPAVSTALSTAMVPIQRALSLDTLVEQRLTTFEMLPASLRVPKGGCQMMFAIPSLVEREIIENEPIGTLSTSIKLGGKVEGVSMSDTKFFHLLHDYRCMMCHLAVSRCDNVSVSTTELEGVSQRIPYLTWGVRTSLRTPAGSSAIYQGEIWTSEPIEALVYTADFEPTTKYGVEQLHLDDFRAAVHVWDYVKASSALGLNPTYLANIRNKTYTCRVDEHEMLGLGIRRNNVRFMKPAMASAIVRIWMAWLLEDEAFIAAEVKTTKDGMVKDALQGRRIQNAIRLVSTLSHIGTNGAGAKTASFIKRRIAQQMAGEGRIDDYAEIHVGVQQHKLNVWAGLAALELLELASSNEANQLIDYIRSTDAFSVVIGTIDLPLTTS